jgi:ABC-2 type transport system ATP-binding protein
MSTAIHIEGLTKYYGNVLAVDHITFEVWEGEIFGFLGPNGAGKTTTQRMLTTLLEPNEGRVSIFGHDLARDAYPVKRQIGLVPEESNVYAELTAWDNLIFTARLYRMPRTERDTRARELLETFDLWEKRDVKVENFSKGMRRRLSIAMAVIHRPRLLFLDEPTPGLDAQSARTIHKMIQKMNAEGTTIFLTTHLIEEASLLCDRVAIINQGRIAAIDTPEKLKQAFRRVQSIEVSVEPNGQAHGQAMGCLPGVTSSIKIGDKWRLYTENPAALLPQLMNYARLQGLEVISLNTLGPSLEDVFLEITGQPVGESQPRTKGKHTSKKDRKKDRKDRIGDGR